MTLKSKYTILNHRAQMLTYTGVFLSPWNRRSNRTKMLLCKDSGASIRRCRNIREQCCLRNIGDTGFMFLGQEEGFGN